uniref:CCHC-type domain-containing protein n=1 Tax=Cajanus cajan TaxID=3821 RepID=A0A151UEG9_CAJCA
MEEFSTPHSDSNSSDYNDISKVSHELRSLKIWKEQESKQRLKEKLEREAQLALLEEEIRLLKEKEEKLHHRHRSKHSSQAHSSTMGESMHDDSLALGDHYQQPPKRVHRTPKTRESRVDLPYFHGKDDVEGYLDWEMKVEQQNLRKNFKTSSYSSPYSKVDYKREGKTFEKKNTFDSSKNLDKGKEKEEKEKKNTSHTSTKSSDIKCFKCLGRGHIASQCPNKKVMILRGQDIYSSQDEATTSPSSSEDEEEASEGESCEVTYPYNGELLMMRRVLNNQPSDTQSQRENIFHTRCNISNKACSLIVDSGSWCNCCSTRI